MGEQLSLGESRNVDRARAWIELDKHNLYSLKYFIVQITTMVPAASRRVTVVDKKRGNYVERAYQLVLVDSMPDLWWKNADKSLF